MKQSTRILVVSVIGLMATTAAMADDVYYDTARVVNVTPQIERVNMPRQECHTDYVPQRYNNNDDRSVVGSIIGGVTGGLLGSQVGKGKGRIAAAAVGAGVGAVVGDRIDNDGNNNYGSRPVDRCVAVDNYQTVNRGYLVTYRLYDHTYSTVMPNDPGDSIRVRVAVAPSGPVQPISYLESGYRADDRYRDRGEHRGWDRHDDDDWRR